MHAGRVRYTAVAESGWLDKILVRSNTEKMRRKESPGLVSCLMVNAAHGRLMMFMDEGLSWSTRPFCQDYRERPVSSSGVIQHGHLCQSTEPWSYVVLYLIPCPSRCR